MKLGFKVAFDDLLAVLSMPATGNHHAAETLNIIQYE
jgi:hypothetical protein